MKSAELTTEDTPITGCARSLKPGIEVMDGCVTADPESIAIRDSWRFSFPIRNMTTEELDALDPRVTF